MNITADLQQLDPSRYYVSIKKITGEGKTKKQRQQVQIWLYERNKEGDIPIRAITEKHYVGTGITDALKARSKQLKIPQQKTPRTKDVVKRERKIRAMIQTSQAAYEQSERIGAEKAKVWGEEWINKHPSKAIAIVELLRVMNRWAKRLKYSKQTREAIYEVKDKWISQNQQYLTLGQKVRDEEYTDHGTDWNDWFISSDYEEMGEDAMYEFWQLVNTRTLYSHTFSIEGLTYNFHSYVVPVTVSSELGVDLPAYGTPLSDDEIVNLGLWENATYSQVVSLIDSWIAELNNQEETV